MTAPAPAPSLSEAAGASAASSFTGHMARGIAAHEAGNRILALSAFEAALAMAPGHVQAVSACATLLFELARPRAALACLTTVKAQLLADEDGAVNLGIASAACGDLEAAKSCFLRALEHNASHPRALQHLAAIHVQDEQWEAALAWASRWLAVAADQPAAWLAVADVLVEGRQLQEALAHLAQALRRFSGHAPLALRQAVTLARCGELTASDALLATLVSNTGGDQQPAADARSIFYHHAFEALQDGDWRDQDRLRALIQQDLAAWPETAANSAHPDMRATLVCGPLLPLEEREMQLAARATWQTLIAGPQKTGRPFSAADVLSREGPIRIGIAAHSLRDETATSELAALLAGLDTSRFECHVYSPTPQPQSALTAALAPHCVIEIAHFSDDEAIARIRLDRLDIWMDLSFGSAWWRPAIAARRVAPVQVQHPDWQRQPAHGPVDYTLSDVFMHPVPAENGDQAALIRWPHTCWSALPWRIGPAGITREQAGLPAGALVLCAFAPALHIDAHSFGLWMQLLSQSPEAVLWLPPLSARAQANLRREAAAAGVDASRLYFAVATTRQQRLACLALADLFIDTLRINARQDLCDALCLGVPAISCAGSSMASRMGGSILHAAGLGDCVVDREAAYVETVLRLARAPAALLQLRGRLQAGFSTAPLFDLPARMRELQAAWTFMAQRARHGLPPASFNVPAEPA